MCVLLEAWTRSWGKMGQICGFGWSEARWRWHRVQKETKSEAGTVGKQGRWAGRTVGDIPDWGHRDGSECWVRITECQERLPVFWQWIREWEHLEWIFGNRPRRQAELSEDVSCLAPILHSLSPPAPCPGNLPIQISPTAELWTAEVKWHDWRRELQNLSANACLSTVLFGVKFL